MNSEHIDEFISNILDTDKLLERLKEEQLASDLIKEDKKEADYNTDILIKDLYGEIRVLDVTPDLVRHLQGLKKELAIIRIEFDALKQLIEFNKEEPVKMDEVQTFIDLSG